MLHPKATDIEAGSLVSENGMQLARQRALKAGVIKADDLARGFAWLRPNDLVWNYVINKLPARRRFRRPLTCLFWECQTPPNLSASLWASFLTIYETLAFTKQGEVEMVDHKIDLSKVTADLFILGGVDRSHHPVEGDLSFDPAVRFQGRDLRAQPVGPYAGDPQPADQSQGEILRPEEEGQAPPPPPMHGSRAPRR